MEEPLLPDILIVIAGLIALALAVGGAALFYLHLVAQKRSSPEFAAYVARNQIQQNRLMFVLGTFGAILIRVFGGIGWYGFFFSVPYAILVCVHIVIMIVVLRSPLRSSMLVWVAELVFVLALALQWDVGDEYSWLAITGFALGPGNAVARPPFFPNAKEHVGMPYDLALFVPVVAMWWYLLKRRKASLAPPDFNFEPQHRR